jgi:hypothetical protein
VKPGADALARFALTGRVFNFAQTYVCTVASIWYMGRAGRSIDMTTKPTVPKEIKKQTDVSHPGMMGDGTEEQNLNQRGNPTARIKKDELDAAFGKQNPKK